MNFGYFIPNNDSCCSLILYATWLMFQNISSSSLVILIDLCWLIHREIISLPGHSFCERWTIAECNGLILLCLCPFSTVPKGRVRSLSTALWSLTHLTALHLSDNSLSRIPPDIAKLHNLVYLDLSSNKIRSLPAELGNLVSLRWVISDKVFMPWSSNSVEAGVKRLMLFSVDSVVFQVFYWDI